MSRTASTQPPRPPARPLHRDVVQQHVRDIFSLLLVFRLINACVVFTFFQPDEYYQALEPAWMIAFGDVGKERGAWLTWEWQHALRSSLLPYAVALVYHIGRIISTILVFPHPVRAQLYVLLPNLVTGALTAVGEFATWQLAENVYGSGSSEGWAAVLMSLANPWLFFTGTRTLSNTIEAALTAVALLFWPWALADPSTQPQARQAALKKTKYSIILAGTACILRPTNALIWVPITLWTFTTLSLPDCTTFVMEAGLYGGAVIALTSALDYQFYGRAVFPPFEWLRYNLQQNLAVFYGVNRLDYYATEGLPLILTTLLPFALIGIWQGVRSTASASVTPTKRDKTHTTHSPGSKVARPFSLAVLSTVAALTSISHKEARFLSPLLPVLHILAARPLVSFAPTFARRRVVLALALVVNILLALYATQFHQAGPLALVSHLRKVHQDRNVAAVSLGGARSGADADESAREDLQRDTSVALLMPCHSTPWRSHLYYEALRVWALTCEPPADLSPAEREVYVDEADAFYADPIAWMDANVQDVGFLRPWMVRAESISSSSAAAPANKAANVKGNGSENGDEDEKRQWPQYVAFFESLIQRGAGPRNGSDVADYLMSKGYEECWRTFSSHVHDDWRRVGDIVLYCVPEGEDNASL